MEAAYARLARLRTSYRALVAAHGMCARSQGPQHLAGSGEAGADATSRALVVGLLASAGLASTCLAEAASEPQPASSTKAPSPPAATAKAASPGSQATAQWRVFTDRGREAAARGDYEEAERYLRRALDLAREGFGEDDPHVGSAAHNLAELYRVRRDYAAAEPLYREALRLLLAVYGEEDVRVAFALHNLAGLHYAQGHWEEAATLYREAADVKCRLLGPSHEETISSRVRLAETEWSAGKWEEALQAMRVGVNASGSGVTAGTVGRTGRFADMLLQAGHTDEAERHLRDILDYAEKAQDAELGSFAQAAERLAGALQANGQFEQADRAMRSALFARIKAAGETREHVSVAATMRRYAALLLREIDSGDKRARDRARLAARARQLALDAADIAGRLLGAAEAPDLMTRALGWFRPDGELGELARHIRLCTLRLESTACEMMLGEAMAAAGAGDAAARVLGRAQTRLEAWMAQAGGEQHPTGSPNARWLAHANSLHEAIGAALTRAKSC